MFWKRNGFGRLSPKDTLIKEIEGLAAGRAITLQVNGNVQWRNVKTA